MTAKNRVTVNLTDEEYAALQRLAVDEDRSMAWLGRQGIKLFLRQNGLLNARRADVLETLGQLR